MMMSSPTDDGTNDDAGEPVFTPLEGIVERACLKETEIQEIVSDLHGLTAGVNDLRMDDPPRPTAVSILEDVMSKLPTTRTDAYCQAVIKCPGLVSDERKLVFLKRENGDPALAAVRLALHWECRLEIFGPERCFLPMTLTGAMRGEVENMVRWPIHHLLPVKDTAGRAIWYAEPTRRDFEHYSYKQELMQLWYILEVASEDPEVLKNGLVLLSNWKDLQLSQYPRRCKGWKPTRGFIVRLLAHALPIHLRALHYCHPSMALYDMLPEVLHIMGKDFRLRHQMHRGSEEAILKDLEPFCLPKSRVPIELGGEVVLDASRFLVDRLSLESARPDPRNALYHQSIVVPGGPSAKRIRSENPQEENQGANNGQRRDGRKSDPRMTRAIEARLANPDLTPQEALEKGGFAFDFLDERNEVVDAENITLQQRKNQLCRRLRKLKNAGLIPQQQEQPVQQSAEARTSTGSSSSSNNSASEPTPTTACRVTSADIAPSLERRDSFDEAISEVVDGDEPNIAAFLVERRYSFDDAISKVDAEESDFMAPVLERRDSFDEAISGLHDVEVNDIAAILERKDSS